MQIHQVVAGTVAAHGVTEMFGLMGDANMLYVTGFIDDHGGRFVPVADERSSVLMAGAHAMAGGSVGVATVTHGPAVTNVVTALIEHVRGRVPLVLITGDTPGDRDYVQWVDLRAVAGLAGAGYERVWSAGTAGADVAHAFRRAVAERRPVILDVPYDVLEHDGSAVRTVESPSPQRLHPDPASVARAAEEIARSERVVILAGRGAVLSGARESIIALADHLGAPLSTSLLAKDYFRGHRLDLGASGAIATPVAQKWLREADCVVAFGASLNKYTAAGGDVLRAHRVIHVDTDPARFGAFTPVTVPVVGDARVVADQLRSHLSPRDGQAWTEELEAALSGLSPFEGWDDMSDDETIDLRTAMITLDRVAPRRRNLVTDVGRFMRVPWKYVHVDDPMGFVHSVNYGSIGLGLATAMGVSTARRDRLTLAVLGDGGLMQSAAELSTLATQQLPTAVVVANDGAYGAEWRKLTSYGVDPRHSLNRWPDLVEVAAGFGIAGRTVRSVEDLEALSEDLATLTRPLLVDVRMNPSIEVSETGR